MNLHPDPATGLQDACQGGIGVVRTDQGQHALAARDGRARLQPTEFTVGIAWILDARVLRPVVVEGPSERRCVERLRLLQIVDRELDVIDHMRHRPIVAERVNADRYRAASWPTYRQHWAEVSMTQARKPASITVTPILVADLHIEGERMPVYVHLIDHPDGRVLVDTGMTDLHPLLADMDPRLWPLSEQDLDLASIDIVVNTHLHGDHCGGNHLFSGRPIYVQRRELDDARSQDDYSIREWVEPPGVHYVPIDGEVELLPGIRLLPAPGHTPGTQVVVVETGERPIVIGGDVAVWHGEFDEPPTEGRTRVIALNPELVWLAHAHEPYRQPPT